MSRLTIFGAGLSGLIAARMTADRMPKVKEAQDKLPNNHKALLRFRSHIVGDACNIPFEHINVIKAVHGGVNAVADAVSYSLKVTGKLQARSILDLKPVERYIAPSDLIARLASTADIEYGIDFVQWSSELIKPDHAPVISTIPMPAMMKIFKWKDIPDFNNQHGWTYRATIDPDLESTFNATVYCPDLAQPWYRASLTGSILMIEGVGPMPSSFDIGPAVTALGLLPKDIIDGTLSSSRYQKIGELNGRERESAKRFTMWLTEKHGIYSLGRYAVWRPKLLLDDIVNDVRVICRLIDGENLYKTKKETN